MNAPAPLAKLSGPEFVKTPELGAPPPRVPPRMTGAPRFAESEPDARRVQAADFVDFATWLVPKLAERYRRIPEDIVGYLKYTASDRHHAFFRHKDAALLVFLNTVTLERAPVAVELFGKIRATKADPQETRQYQQRQLLELYRIAHDWAKSIKSLYFRYGDESDIPQAALYDAVPNASKTLYCVSTLT